MNIYYGRNRDKYQLIILSPNKWVIMAPAAIYGPQGISVVLSFFLDRRIDIPPITAPINEAKKITINIILGPSKAPMPAISLISPPPIASFWNILEPTNATKYRTAPPTNIPNRDCHIVMLPLKKENINPIPIRGMVRVSGRILVSKSMNDKTGKLHPIRTVEIEGKHKEKSG